MGSLHNGIPLLFEEIDGIGVEGCWLIFIADAVLKLFFLLDELESVGAVDSLDFDARIEDGLIGICQKHFLYLQLLFSYVPFHEVIQFLLEKRNQLLHWLPLDLEKFNQFAILLNL